METSIGVIVRAMRHGAGMATVNRATRAAPIRTLPLIAPRALFLTAYPAIAATCRAVEEPGLAVLAVDELTGRVAGMLGLRAGVQRHVTAVIGRHDRCDLHLPQHEALALRHLAVILEPVTSWRRGDASVRYRILDLRTEAGFSDEDGRALRGLRCEAAAVVRCAGYTIFALPLGDPSDWPAAASDAWSFLPERVYFDERYPQRRTTLIRTAGPRDQTDTRDATPAGHLELALLGSTRAVPVSNAALADGVVLGRYARCTGAVDELSVSRVHALLIKLGGTVVVVDLASTHGLRAGAALPERVSQVSDDRALCLGPDLQVRWRPRSSSVDVTSRRRYEALAKRFAPGDR